MEVNKQLIFDIGMHRGEDTEYYLREGYKVVAVEANPILANECRQKFEKEIASGQLLIVNAGIGEKEGIMPFYVNKYQSEWSSFDKAIGTRNNTEFEVMNVHCVTTQNLFQLHGVPFYLKVDIEGYDYLALKDISENGPKPPYVSCEAGDISWLDILYSKGYRKFKFINQANNFKPYNLNREKNRYYVIYRKIKHGINHRLRNILRPKFPGGSSGPFGENTKGNWKSYEEIRHTFLEYLQGDLKTPVNHISWMDFHAAL